MGIGSMSVEKSKAVPKALWLALIFVGMMSAYSDIHRPRLLREDAGRGPARTRAAHLAPPQALNGILPERPETTLRR